MVFIFWWGGLFLYQTLSAGFCLPGATLWSISLGGGNPLIKKKTTPSGAVSAFFIVALAVLM
ncbi:hypothetical protein ACVGWD_00530, partial [Enterobacter asburiae]